MLTEKALLLFGIIWMNLQRWTIETKHHELIKPFEIDFNMLQKRCDLICYRTSLDKCSVRNCLQDISKLTKPGQCLYSIRRTVFDETCIEDCQPSLDYECPGVQKCCHQPSCGSWSCQEPLGLLEDVNLPPVPFNVTVTQKRRKGRICEISWEMPLNQTQTYPTIFVVEGRSHIGSVFSEHKLADWQWYEFNKIAEKKNYFTGTKTTVANLKLRTGRWHQFRVAAINEFGLRGYSTYSQEFKLSDQNHLTAPKPPKSPRNFTISPIRLLPNHTVYARASWVPPKSDLPIEKYRITWALYLKADNDSLLLNDAFIMEPIRHYELWDLAANSLYYVQLQAISIIGKKKLKSPKESLLLDTTVKKDSSSQSNQDWKGHPLINSAEYETKHIENISSGSLKTLNKQQLPDIVIKFIASRKFGMIVRVHWSDQYRGSLLELCAKKTGCAAKEYGVIKAKKDYIDFSKLKFNTQYFLRLIDSNTNSSNNNDDEGNSHENILQEETFTTPTCENFKRKFLHLSIIC